MSFHEKNCVLGRPELTMEIFLQHVFANKVATTRTVFQSGFSNLGWWHLCFFSLSLIATQLECAGNPRTQKKAKKKKEKKKKKKTKKQKKKKTTIPIY